MKTFLIAVATIVILMVIGLAGTAEKNEQIIYAMPNEVYDDIVMKLGGHATDKEIVAEFLANYR